MRRKKQEKTRGWFLIILGGKDENVRIFIVWTDSPQRISHFVKLFFFLIRLFSGAETGCEHF